jgi:DnaJ-domain-containing protein 1
MQDCFQLLGLRPQAALDLAALDEAYLAATRLAHPDQAGGSDQASAGLNAALEILRNPITRLKHLLDLHSGLMSLFEKLGPLLQQTQAFLARKQAASSALAKALLASEELRLRESLEELGTAIEDEWQALESRLPDCDERIAAGDNAAWADLQALQARLAYLGKWKDQIRARLLELML